MNDPENGGKIVIGGSNPELYYEPVRYAPATRKAYWQFTVDR